MNSPPRFAYVTKTLSGVAVCLSLYWLYQVSQPWLNLFDTPQSNASLLFSLIMPVFMGFPALIGLYFGCLGLKRTDAGTIKGLVAAYCISLVCLLAVFLDAEVKAFPLLNEDIARDVVLVLLSIVALVVFWFVYRYFLRSLGHPCPPVRQSLPRWPIGLIAYFVFSMLIELALYRFPVQRENQGMNVLCFVCSIVVAALVYKLGVWLFVEQKATAAKGDLVDA